MTKHKGQYAGLDLSLAGTGGVLLDKKGEVVSVLAFSTGKREAAAPTSEGVRIILSPEVKQGNPATMWSRTVYVMQQIADWLDEYADKRCRIAIEDHAFGAQGTSIYQLGHLHGLVRHMIHRKGYQWLLVAPTELKSAVTGKGNADKNAMMKVPTPKLNQELFGSSTRNNVVDAYWLARVMMAYSEVQVDHGTWGAIPESMAKVLRPHAKKPGLAARGLLP